MKNYPSTSETHKQERRSIRAFNEAVSEEMFIVRNEREDDYGVDLSLELVFNSIIVTNIRSQIQLKSDTDGKRNKDGTYSYPVPIVNINYLMNQPNSLFVVYVEGEKTLLWEWVTKIVQNSKERGIDINTTDQKTISYRFYKVLDKEHLRDIHSKILKNGQLVRNFTELTSFAVESPVKATIDLESSNIMTSEECESVIKQYGFWLVNQGRYSDIKLLEDGMKINARIRPEISIVLAYGKFHSGNYYEALALVPKGVQLDFLSDNLKDIAVNLFVHLNFLLGIMGSDKYLDHLAAIETSSPESLLSLQTKMYRLRDELYSIDRTKIDDYKKLTKELQSVIKEIKDKAVDSFELLIRIKLFEWEIEGYNLLIKLMTQFFQIRGRAAIGRPISEEQRKAAAKETIFTYTSWFRRYQVMEKKGWESNGIAAFAYLSYAQLQLLILGSFRALELGAKKEELPFLINIKEKLGQLIITLEKEGDVFQSLLAKLALAETEIGLGNSENAMGISKQVIQSAEIYGITDLIHRAQRIYEGNSIFGNIDIISTPKTSDEHFLELADDQIPMYVRQTAQMLKLPYQNLSNLEIEYRWLREDAFERQKHCRYIHVLQDLRHSKQLETSYSINPNRMYTCEYFKHESQIIGNNREYLLTEFKDTFCKGCAQKKPNECTSS